MQTNSAVARAVAYVAIALAIPALFVFAVIHHVRIRSCAVTAQPAVVAGGSAAPNAVADRTPLQ